MRLFEKVEELIQKTEELGTRPAMNGGFKKLAKQQTVQSRRLERVERDMGDIHQTLKWVKRIGTAIFVGVVVELAVKGVDHLHVVLH